jgi:hypothetical protein
MVLKKLGKSVTYPALELPRYEEKGRDEKPREKGSGGLTLTYFFFLLLSPPVL